MKKFAIAFTASIFISQSAFAVIKLDSERTPYEKLNSKANQETRDVVKELAKTTKENQQLLNQLNLSLQKTNSALGKLTHTLQQMELSLNAQLVKQKKLYELEKKMAEYQLKKDKKKKEAEEAERRAKLVEQPRDKNIPLKTIIPTEAAE